MPPIRYRSHPTRSPWWEMLHPKIKVKKESDSDPTKNDDELGDLGVPCQPPPPSATVAAADTTITTTTPTPQYYHLLSKAVGKRGDLEYEAQEGCVIKKVTLDRLCPELSTLLDPRAEGQEGGLKMLWIGEDSVGVELPLRAKPLKLLVDILTFEGLPRYSRSTDALNDLIEAHVAARRYQIKWAASLLETHLALRSKGKSTLAVFELYKTVALERNPQTAAIVIDELKTRDLVTLYLGGTLLMDDLHSTELMGLMVEVVKHAQSTEDEEDLDNSARYMH